MTYQVKSSTNQNMLREAITSAIKYRNDPVELDPGDYVFETPLVIGDGPFSTVNMGGRLRGSSHTRLLFPTIKDRPLITINDDRASYFHDFTVTGANDKQPVDFEPSNNPDDYLSAGTLSDRYGGHLGIAIDHKAKAGSWDMTFERVDVEKCGVGWAITPDGTTLNSSGHKWIDCGVSYCDIGFSWGQSQARTNYITRLKPGFTRILFTGAVHGLQQGVPPIVDGMEISFVHTLGHFNSRFGQVLSWNNIWAENIKGIVHWMGRGGSAAVFRNSTFDISMVNPVNPMLGLNNQKPCVAEAHSPMIFDNCHISINPRSVIPFVQGSPKMFEFVNMPNFEKSFVLG